MVEGRLFPSALVMRRGIKQPLQDAVERTVLTSLDEGLAVAAIGTAEYTNRGGAKI